MPDTDTDTDDYTEVEVDVELMNRLRDAQQAYDEVREYLDEVKAEVKQRFADHDKVIGTFDGEKIFTCVKRDTTRINSTKLKRDYPDIWLAYATTRTTAYLTVHRPKADS